MKQTFWSLGWRSLWRDLRSGDLRLLIVAVTLAVAALSAVGFFADRLKGGLQRDARQLLGGDAVIASDNPTPEIFVAKARALGLTMVSTLGFPTMARAEDTKGGASKLVALKAVEPGYPLRGSLRMATDTGAEQPTRDIPKPGEVWVDAPLLESLGLAKGDSLLLGDSRFTVTGVIALEPDRGAGFMNFAPRVMMNTQDVAATGLIQPASRLNYRMAMAGDEPQVKAFVAWADKEVKDGANRAERVQHRAADGAPIGRERQQSRADDERGQRHAAQSQQPLQRGGGVADGLAVNHAGGGHAEVIAEHQALKTHLCPQYVLQPLGRETRRA